MRAEGISEIDAMVGTGHGVIGGGDEAVVATVKAAIQANLSVSFYLSKAQSAAVRDWYWTPERVAATGMEEISAAEHDQIESDLGLTVKQFRFATVDCRCGHRFTAYDFLKQGIDQHGLETVRATLSMANGMLFQINPTFEVTCPECDRPLADEGGVPDGFEYDCDGYGGCSYPIAVLAE